VLTIRSWLQQEFVGEHRGPAWSSLWELASAADFEIAQASNDTELLTLLGKSDQLELHLRHLAAAVYERRTFDHIGAQSIRAVTAPGSGCDIAPQWLVAEATAASKADHQRTERVEAEQKRRKGKGDGKGDQKGTKKGDHKGGKGGKNTKKEE